MEKDFIHRDEALAHLNIKAATLYSYVSRGMIRSIPQADPRKSLYSRADVERLGIRSRGKLGRAAAAESSMRWGEPVINSSITYISDSGPVYRNRPAVDLARAGASFETVAHFLLTGVWHDSLTAWPLAPTPSDIWSFLSSHAKAVDKSDIGNLLGMVSLALGMRGRSAAEIADGTSVATARLILQTLIGCLGFLSKGRQFVDREAGEALVAYVIRATGAPDTPDTRKALNATLIVLADHELAASTFAARVAASTNADLFNCVATAISSHVGFSIGAATEKVESMLFHDLDRKRLESRLGLVKEYGGHLFGFNHPLYPKGDPRAELILEMASSLAQETSETKNIFGFLERAKNEFGAKPGVAVALVALSRVINMPPGASTALWIVGRIPGWVAHALEQRTQAFMLRPRAKYSS